MSDPWHYPRAELAGHYLRTLDVGLSNNLTLFSPRRMGKTEFLRADLGPAAAASGWRVFYFSFMLDAVEVGPLFVDSAAAFARSRAASWLKPLTSLSWKTDSLNCPTRSAHSAGLWFFRGRRHLEPRGRPSCRRLI